MIKYSFKDDQVILKNAAKADPQKIGEALAKITDANAGRLMPETVVNAARDTKSPLHAHFEWNDKVAAHAHRLDQARNLIRMIRVEDEETNEVKPAFMSVQDGGVAYRKVDEVVNSRALQLIVLQQAERDLTAFRKRYHMLNDVCALVGQAQEALEQTRNELETRAAA